MAPKRQKTAHGEISGNAADVEADVSIIDPTIFSPSVLADAKASYAAAKPYTHGVVTPLCDDARLRTVQAEMREHLTATFKETDLFKVLQTGDLVTVDRANPELVPKIPNLLRLRAAIYSPEFREMVQRMTGCAPLTDRIDCSANVYPRSGHLLCHDDVIGTRCISYIVYLTDPDVGWDEVDGGALELYPVESPGTPAVDPSVSLLPKWNSMAFFTVQPGRSFHAVQEVFADGKPRLSISGWYHAAAPPEGSERATLTQLKTRTGGGENGAEDDDVAEFVPFPSAIQAVIAAAAQASTTGSPWIAKGPAVERSTRVERAMASTASGSPTSAITVSIPSSSASSRSGPPRRPARATLSPSGRTAASRRAARCPVNPVAPKSTRSKRRPSWSLTPRGRRWP